MAEKTIATSLDKTQFSQHLRRVLTALYDPGVLRTSPLLEIFELQHNPAGGAALRRVLTDSIESLRPGSSTPISSRSWRMYHILRRRYTEQSTQHEVASDLGLSVRQLQREEKAAREVLLDYLANKYNLSQIINHISGENGTAEQDALQEQSSETIIAPTDVNIPTLDDELAQLRDAVPARPVDVKELVEEVLQILTPLINSAKMQVTTHFDADLPHIVLRPPMLRQALLNIITTATRCSTGHQLEVTIRKRQQYIVTEITAQSRAGCEYDAPPNTEDSLAMAEQLIRLCKGTLELGVCDTQLEKRIRQFEENEHLLCVKMVLPAAEQVPVLMIDDNRDVLQLYQRYLTGSAYRYIGAQTAEQGLQQALATQPEIIVLDVMMPGQDGWTLLGQLREHPQTAHIPVIVCSILTQEDLALALGAADYVRKPINRVNLLAVLNRQSSRQPLTSG